MRIPTYLSPSGLGIFEQNTREYYKRYLTPVKIPRFPQTKPMSVGSAFDAYVKVHIVDILIPENPPEGFTVEKLLEKQVEPHNLEWAREHGKKVFDFYCESGALADLMEDLFKSAIVPRFEFEINAEIEGVPIFGYPDCFYLIELMKSILDWKVTGYCSKNGAKPKPHWIKCRPVGAAKTDRHKKANVIDYKGVEINIGCTGLEETDKVWATQQCLYAWGLGAEIGSKFLCTLEQLCYQPAGPKVYTYRAPIGKEFQFALVERLKTAWKIINSGHIFRDFSEKESHDEQKRIDDMCDAFMNGNPEEQMMARMGLGL